MYTDTTDVSSLAVPSQATEGGAASRRLVLSPRLFSAAAWHPVVRVGAINCAQSENTPICRDHRVTRFPNIRFFRPMTQEGDIGEQMPKMEQAQDMLALIVDYVTEVQQNTPQPTWPSLQPMQ